MAKAEKKLLAEANDKIVELTVAITLAWRAAIEPLSDGTADAYIALERASNILAPHARKPF